MFLFSWLSIAAVGALMLIGALTWRYMHRAQMRSRIAAALDHRDPQRRRAGVLVATEQGLRTHADMLADHLDWEDDPDVLSTLVEGVLRNSWEPADQPAILRLRLWAHEHRALSAMARPGLVPGLGADDEVPPRAWSAPNSTDTRSSAMQSVDVQSVDLLSSSLETSAMQSVDASSIDLLSPSEPGLDDGPLTQMMPAARGPRPASPLDAVMPAMRGRRHRGAPRRGGADTDLDALAPSPDRVPFDDEPLFPVVPAPRRELGRSLLSRLERPSPVADRRTRRAAARRAAAVAAVTPVTAREESLDECPPDPVVPTPRPALGSSWRAALNPPPRRTRREMSYRFSNIPPAAPADDVTTFLDDDLAELRSRPKRPVDVQHHGHSRRAQLAALAEAEAQVESAPQRGARHRSEPGQLRFVRSDG